ncbi:MAG: hypothetical protein GY822_01695 [Deltaproteobacteria bacterium]|nr:hypothetical protein [Deltaproteobacteria bacterium]
MTSAFSQLPLVDSSSPRSTLERMTSERSTMENGRTRMKQWACTSLLLPLLLPISGCNDHVFVAVEENCSPTLAPSVKQPEDLPADILLVIDNSGSMCEEQANLVSNFFDENCPITDLDNVPDEFRNPTDTIIADQLQDCGFIQILAAYDSEFRVGITTTDVGQCDNRFGLAENEQAASFICAGHNFPGWGRRPQRGCLQGAPGSDKKFIEKGDTNIGETFKATLDNVQTFGSGFERGLDAMEVFLDKNSDRAPGCESDRDDFIREDAKLIVIFISDEDDCSHRDGIFGAVDENLGESCDNATETPAELRDVPTSASNCYDVRDSLAPIDGYASFLNNVKGINNRDRVSVAVIAGATFNGVGGAVSGGCRIVAGDNPDGQCSASKGNSFLCDPEDNCCDADSGDRYFQFASQIPKNLTDSICFESFRSTMVSIAQFIAAQNQFQLQEDSADVDQMTVHICREGAERVTDCEFVVRIPDGEVTEDRSGWQLTGTRTINLYGASILQPGEELRIFAPAVLEGRSCSSVRASDGGS